MPESLPNVVQLSIPFFLIAMLLELAWSRRNASVRYATRDTFASLAMGAGRVVEGLLFGGIAASVLAFAHRFAWLEIPFAPWAFVVAFVIDDLRYYVYHRAAHRIRWFWAEHVNHHSSQHYNLSTALRQSWTGSLGGSVLFKVPLALIGFDPVMLLFVAGLNTVAQFWIHTEAIRRLPWPIEFIFNTPSHHRVHHARNPRYLDANYAGALIIWDRMFGTFVPEDEAEPCRYGIVKNLATFNPVRIAFHEWAALFRDVTRPGLTLGQRLSYAFGVPGYSHDGSRKTSDQLKAEDAAAAQAAK